LERAAVLVGDISNFLPGAQRIEVFAGPQTEKQHTLPEAAAAPCALPRSAWCRLLFETCGEPFFAAWRDVIAEANRHWTSA